MCCKGRMFAPTKTWQRWHHKVNLNQRHYPMCSALAATALPALVTALGHCIRKVGEIPLVVIDSVQYMKKTKEAVKLLKTLKSYEDVDCRNRQGGFILERVR